MLAVHHFHVVVEQDDHGFFVSCPALPGCSTQGTTYEEAMKNIREAIDLYIEDLVASGESIPASKSVTVAGVDIQT